MSQPKLDFEIIYVDECQDSNPCFLEILKNQTAKVIFVGDKYQAIYQWRGAVNALESIEGQVLNLSTSFRYGQDVADLACKVLDNQLTLTSFEGLSTEVGENVVDKTKPYTILYRTNQKLVLDAVKAIQDGLSVNIEIDVRDFCNMLTSAVALYRNDMSKVKHEDLLSYNNFQELKDEAEGNGAFGRLVQIIESGQSYQVINALQYHKNSPKADITFTTAHKAKGREWNQVELADDFPRHIRNNEWVGLEPEEMNLLYVATTRARQKLNINKTLSELWYKDLMDKKDRGLQIDIKEISCVSAGGRKQVLFSKATGGGEMAEAALEYASITSEQAWDYMDGDMSDEDAYEAGIIDEMGFRSFTGTDLSPDGSETLHVRDYVSTCEALETEMLRLRVN